MNGINLGNQPQGMANIPDPLPGSPEPRQPVLGPAAQAGVIRPAVRADDRRQHAVAVGEGGAEARGRAGGGDAADGQRGVLGVRGQFAVEAGVLCVGLGVGVAGEGAHARAEVGGVVDGRDAGVGGGGEVEGWDADEGLGGGVLVVGVVGVGVGGRVVGGGDGEKGAVGGGIVLGELGGRERAVPELEATEEVCALGGPDGLEGWVAAFLDLEGCDFLHEKKHSIVRAG